MLNGELKQLYTAVTRARVNLWIFDEDSEKRAPAFKYFIKRDFVRVVKADEKKGEAALNFFRACQTGQSAFAFSAFR